MRRIRKAKIIATLGPSSSDSKTIRKLFYAGADVFRLNFSHGTSSQYSEIAKRIRKHAAIEGRYVGILADLQGPKIRIGDFKEHEVQLKIGDKFRLDLSSSVSEGTLRSVSVPYENLAKYVEPNDILLLDDGRIRLKVESVEENLVDCLVLVGGTAAGGARGPEDRHNIHAGAAAADAELEGVLQVLNLACVFVDAVVQALHLHARHDHD